MMTVSIESIRRRAQAAQLCRAAGRCFIAHEHDLAGHATLAEELLRIPRLRKRKASCDERPDLALAEELEQRDQVFSKQRRPHPLQPLDAVRNDAPAPGKQPAAGDVQTEDRDSAKPPTPARLAGSEPSAA